MNILVVAHYQNDNSPTAIFIHAQVLAYRRLGHSVRVAVPIAFGKKDTHGRRLVTGIRQEEIDGIPHYFIHYLSLSKYGEKRFNTATAIRIFRANLRTILDGFVPDVIHAHTLGLDSEIGAWLKESLGVPLVVTTHGSDTSIPIERGRGAELKPLCDRADMIVAVSSVLAGKVRACGTGTPMSVMLNGFDQRALPEVGGERGHTLIQVGSLQEQKRVHVTVRAFAQVRERYPNAYLTLAGSGPDRAKLEALCRELGISGAVRFLGTIPNREVLAEMSKARFFILPSVREGFGIVYLEAMACGCVTIGTEGEGIADLIASGKNGFLVPPDDPEAIARTIEWCLEHPEETSAIAERGREDAMSLTWEKNAGRYINLFKELIS